tara:strand:+ start:2713 stop:3084 length:372 start_codon:yes stop_codon:yes gene_type:complete
MPLTELTKITGPGIKTDTNWVGNNGNFTGIVTATKFVGDISEATGGAGGLGTAISSDNTKPLNLIYYVNDTLHITENSLVEVPSTSSVAYTQHSNVQVEDNINLTINDNVEFVADILNLSDFM